MSEAVDVDLIVREVLKRLSARDGRTEEGIEKRTNGKAVAKSELRLTGRLVTRADLDGRLDGLKVVTAAPRTILTPAARDYLKEHGVSVEYTETETGAASAGVVLGLAETKYDPVALVREMKQQGIEIERLAQSGLAGVVNELADAAARGGKSALLLTDEGMAAVCMANRQRGVRAALAGDVAAVGRAVMSLGANVLAIEPAGRSRFQMREMVKAFCRGGPRSCPEGLRQLLD